MKKRISFITIMAVIIMIFSMCVTAEAKIGTGLMGEDCEGRYFSTQTGYFTVQGKTYYAHKTKSQMYEVGELATSTYRVRGGKMYYFGADGAMLTRKSPREKLSRYIDFNKDGSVHYIYPAGYRTKYERYNANRHRFQVYKHGKWRDEGMQVYPYGWIDWQE